MAIAFYAHLCTNVFLLYPKANLPGK